MKNRKWRSVAALLAFALLVNLMPTMAADNEVIASGKCGAQGDNITWTLTTDGVLTLTGSGEMRNMSLESQYRWGGQGGMISTVVFDDRITSVGMNAFFRCTSLAWAKLPAELTEIAEAAFYDCTSLTLTELPTGLTKIGASAFWGCTSLALTELPSAVTEIAACAFRGCTSLALTELPIGLTEIAKGTFDSCPLALTQLPDKVTYIGSEAFYNCRSLALTELPSGVTEIGWNAFSDCTSLALTELPAGLTKIGAGAFERCSLALTKLPAGLTVIAGSTFYQCSSLALTELPPGITYIGNGAFKFCTSLALTELPLGITYIGDEAFRGCTSLALVELPAGVTVGKSAFFHSSWRFKTNHYVPDKNGYFELKETTESTAIGTAKATIQDYTAEGYIPVSNSNELLKCNIDNAGISVGNAIVLRRYYDLKKVTISIIDDEGRITTQEVPYGGTAAEPELEDKPGYTLSWETEDGEPFDFDTPITESVTITPVWTANMITVTIQNGEGGTTTQKVPYGGTATEPELEDKPGYTLSWETEDGEPFDFSTPITEPITIQCRYNPISQPEPEPVPIISSDDDDDDDDDNPFNDVKPNDWYYKDVLNAYHAGYIEGATKNTFKPNSPLTRAQAAYAFAKMTQVKLKGVKITNDFEDVTTATTYAAAITWANDAEVEIGYGNGRFGPKDGITREQLALMLYRQYGDRAEAPELDAERFCDADQVSAWAEAAMRWAVHVGLMDSTNAGKLQPQGIVTRAEAASQLVKVQSIKS